MADQFPALAFPLDSAVRVMRQTERPAKVVGVQDADKPTISYQLDYTDIDSDQFVLRSEWVKPTEIMFESDYQELLNAREEQRIAEEAAEAPVEDSEAEASVEE